MKKFPSLLMSLGLSAGLALAALGGYALLRRTRSTDAGGPDLDDPGFTWISGSDPMGPRRLAWEVTYRPYRNLTEDTLAPYPLEGQEDRNRWTEAARETLLKNYNQRDMFI